MSPQELVDEIMMFWFGGVNICFTGGEVFLQPAQDLESALDLLQSATRGADTEVFTNGSQEITRTMRTLFNTIVLDKKLPGSGELYDKGDEDINLSRNLRQLTGRDAIKFTIASAEDFESAREWWNSYMSLENAHFGIPMFFAGVVWGKMKEEELAAMILEAGLPWNLNVQMHKFIWDPEARRT